MKKKRKINWDNIVALICTFLAIWVFASVCDTNIHNRPFTENYGKFSSWNVFNIILD